MEQLASWGDQSLGAIGVLERSASWNGWRRGAFGVMEWSASWSVQCCRASGVASPSDKHRRVMIIIVISIAE